MDAHEFFIISFLWMMIASLVTNKKLFKNKTLILSMLSIEL